MTDIITQAALTTLDYDKPQPEFAVALFAPNLDALVPLLANPQEYILLNTQPGFPYPANGLKPTWNTIPPITVILRDGRYEASLFNRGLAYSKVPLVVPGAPADDVDLAAATPEQIKAQLMRNFDFLYGCTGAFYAELALRTGLIHVTYFDRRPCPGVPTHDPAHPAPTSRYGHTISPVTINKVSFGPISEAFIHFDLKPDETQAEIITDEDRAKFIVSFIENRSMLASLLSGKDFSAHDAVVVDRTDPITPIDPPNISEPTFVPRVDGPGRITVEGLSTGNNTVEPCTVLTASVDDDEYTYDEMYIKAY